MATVIGSAGLLLATDGPGLASRSTGAATNPDDSARAAALRADVREAATAARQHHRIPAHYRPHLAGLRKLADVGDCDYKFPVRQLCVRGDTESTRSIVVFGDSHARHWIPAIDKVAISHGYAAYYLVKPGCNASEMRRSNSAGADACDDFRAWAIEKIIALRPELLVVAGDVPDVTLADSGQQVSGAAALTRLYARGVTRHIREVADAVDHIVVIADTPDRQVTPKACLTRRVSDLGDCAFHPDRKANLEARAARRIASRTPARLVNPRPWFCYRGLCPAIVGDVLTYRDLEHMTTLYSARLAPMMAAELRLEER